MKAQWYFETPVLPEAIPDPFEPPSRPRMRPDPPSPSENPQPPSRNAIGMLEWVTRTVAETLVGARAPAQLEHWLTPLICRRLRIAARIGGWGDPRNAKITCATENENAIDGVAHLPHRGLMVAAAVHLEARQGRWRCTGFDLLLPGTVSI